MTKIRLTSPLPNARLLLRHTVNLKDTIAFKVSKVKLYLGRLEKENRAFQT